LLILQAFYKILPVFCTFKRERIISHLNHKEQHRTTESAWKENKIGGGLNDGHGRENGWRSIPRLNLGRKGAHGRRPARERVRVLGKSNGKIGG